MPTTKPFLPSNKLAFATGIMTHLCFTWHWLYLLRDCFSWPAVRRSTEQSSTLHPSGSCTMSIDSVDARSPSSAIHLLPYPAARQAKGADRKFVFALKLNSLQFPR